MNIFNVIFDSEEKDVLCNYNVVIKNNERNYIYNEKGVIPAYAIPIYYKILDFKYIGTSWVVLINEFIEWFLAHDIKHLDLLNLKNRNNKNIFLNVKKAGVSGPLSNGMYIINNYGVRSWQLIVDLLNYLNIEEKGHIVVHFPFHREFNEIGTLIWRKELKLFNRYLRYLGYSKERAREHLEVVLILSRAYRNYKRRIDYLGNVSNITNPYILTVDSRQDLANLISELKRLDDFKKEYTTTIENMVDFKNEIHYENKNYSNIESDFLNY